jgi:diacylglycerol kinase (ATP)
MKRYLRGLAFALTAFKVLAKEDFPSMRLIHGDTTHVTRFAIVANAHHYGGDLRAASDPALLTSGELQVVLVGRVSGLLRPDVLGSLLARRPLDRSMRFFRATELRACAPGAHVPVQIDGEVWGSLPMSFRVEPEALKVVC